MIQFNKCQMKHKLLLFTKNCRKAHDNENCYFALVEIKLTMIDEGNVLRLVLVFSGDKKSISLK